jgi:deoxyadenosine/deoxycytidine kinase
MSAQDPKIAIVGPCGAGKTTLADQLRELELDAHDIAQEHSYVPDMWRVITKPDLLVFLDASFETCTRRKKLNWTPQEHAEQLRRLEDARRNCDIFIPTDDMDPDEILRKVLEEGGLEGDGRSADERGNEGAGEQECKGAGEQGEG